VTLFRIEKAARKTAREAFSGEGALRIAGRWNVLGLRAVYCSESLSLACLERLVHLESPRSFPKSVYYILDLPDASIERSNAADLPPGWSRASPRPAARKFGSEFLRSGRTIGLAVPSAIIEIEFNVLVNPVHPDFRLAWVKGPYPFLFDARL
jgi:RES domain-containing protein